MSYWTDKNVVVTGGAGFLGSHVVEQLLQHPPETIYAPRSADYDLREKEAIGLIFQDIRPNVVIHLAASVGGIGANRANPGRYFYDNAIMGVQLIEMARQYKVEKLVLIGTVCSYPKFADVPFRERDLWGGYPEGTNAPYGMAKKMLLVQAQAYREQYGMDIIYLIPTNLYGPRDNFDLETCHVIPAIIRKCLEARDSGADHITLWGTGTPTRDFLYVEDCARAILAATERYDRPNPLNLGYGSAVTIKWLAHLIGMLAGFEGEIRWDISQPDGQPRRLLGTVRTEHLLGFRASMPLAEGVQKTIAWYEQERESQP